MSARKIREGIEAVYPVDIITVACPKCGAKPGDKCWETYGGKTFPRATPHRPRILESRPKI